MKVGLVTVESSEAAHTTTEGPVPSRPVPSRPVPSRPVPVPSRPVLSLRSACSVTHKGSGSQFHVCPRPCLSTCRWARLATHRHWGPLCVSPVLSCPLWPCNHRMCVIAREFGLSPLARTCSRTWVFLRRLHIWALSLCLTPFKSENHDPKNWR